MRRSTRITSLLTLALLGWIALSGVPGLFRGHSESPPGPIASSCCRPDPCHCGHEAPIADNVMCASPGSATAVCALRSAPCRPASPLAPALPGFDQWILVSLGSHPGLPSEAMPNPALEHAALTYLAVPDHPPRA